MSIVDLRGTAKRAKPASSSHEYVITSPSIRRELKKRSTIDPVIGHTKADNLLERNYVADPQGDVINALLAAARHNMYLLVTWLLALWRAILTAFTVTAISEPTAA